MSSQSAGVLGWRPTGVERHGPTVAADVEFDLRRGLRRRAALVTGQYWEWLPRHRFVRDRTAAAGPWRFALTSCETGDDSVEC